MHYGMHLIAVLLQFLKKITSLIAVLRLQLHIILIHLYFHVFFQVDRVP